MHHYADRMLPVIAAGAVVAAGATGFALLSRPVGRSIAILGGPQVGKTTLLRVLQDGGAPALAPRPTAEPVTDGKKFRVDIGGKALPFFVAQDVPGTDGLGYPTWRPLFRGSKFVLYLFRADLIAAGHRPESRRVTEQLQTFATWMPRRRGARVVLVGTWADQDDDFPHDAAKLARAVSASPAIKVSASRLRNAPVIVGSLADDASARRLIRALGGHLS